MNATHHKTDNALKFQNCFKLNKHLKANQQTSKNCRFQGLTSMLHYHLHSEQNRSSFIWKNVGDEGSCFD